MGGTRRPSIGTTECLYDLSGDGREAADLARHRPDVLVELRAAYAAVEATLLPYPPDHRGLPRHGKPGIPAISQPD